MKEQKKSRKSGSNRRVLRAILTIIPLPIALSLSLSPDFGELKPITILGVFALGALLGTITHVYWIRVLLREQKFYKEFYDKTVMKPRHFDKEMQIKHTKITLPFYIFGVLAFIIIVFIFGILKIDFSYALPLIFGALDGIPISYYLMEKGPL